MTREQLRAIQALLKKEFAPFLNSDASINGDWKFDALIIALNPDAEPEERHYAGWHARLTDDDGELVIDDVQIGLCDERYGEWSDIALENAQQEQVWSHFRTIHSQLQKALTGAGFTLASSFARAGEAA